ncbi:MAG: phosphoribosyl-AMP cyclohydrolase, partial [Pseudomonadota bacterium]
MTDTHTTDHRWQPPAQAAITALLNRIAFNDRGLVPAIAQDATSAKVLMLAWMNRTALAETLSTGRVCYWSRSRGQLWRKGEQSGHHQYLHDIRYDCDDDAILL